MHNIFFIQPIGPGVVRVHEHEVSYAMTQAEAQRNLEIVRSSREKYGSDVDYLHRVNFYEEILKAFEPTIKT